MTNKRFLCKYFCLVMIVFDRSMFGVQEPVLLEKTTFNFGNSLIIIDKFTYGYTHLIIKEYGEAASLFIGKFCSIADNVTIFLGGNHRVDWITTYPFGHIYAEYLGGAGIQGHPASKGDITIGNDVWIGSHVTIMSGVVIGDGAVIAAHSLVTKKVEPYSIVGGNPARHIRYRFAEDVCCVLQKLKWWNLPINQIKELIPELCLPPDIEKLKIWLKKYREELL